MRALDGELRRCGVEIQGRTGGVGMQYLPELAALVAVWVAVGLTFGRRVSK